MKTHKSPKRNRVSGSSEAHGSARFSVTSHKLNGEPRCYRVVDRDAKQWSYPGSEIVFGPTTSERDAEKECKRLNAPNEKGQA